MPVSIEIRRFFDHSILRPSPVDLADYAGEPAESAHSAQVFLE
jgi:hypothetical protein